MTGGRIEGGSRGVSVSAATSKLTVGEVPAGNVQTEEEAGAVYVSSVYASNASAAVMLNSGTVGRIFGSVGEDFVLNCWFEQDISGYLPASLVAEQENGHWIVRTLTEEDAAAKIGDTLYGSVVKAASELKDGETLTLLKDYEGSQDIEIKVDNATVDLNGFSIINTSEDGYGINFASTYTTSGDGGGVAVVNNGTDTSKITAATPLRTHSGNSLNVLPLTLGDNIELESTGVTYIELGTSACIEYSEAAASYVKTGGFLSTAEGGTQYIYGSFVQAAENDVNKTAVLLNDYQGSISLSSSQALTLDLDGHTVTSGSTSVIQVNTSDASLTIKNGTMITENGTGAEVGLPAEGGTGGTVYYNNIALNLEDVDLTANGSAEDDYGIVCNGMSTGINISLKGGSVNVPNAIGIYFPSADSTLTIDGTTITGTTGVAVKGGDVTIKGGAQISGTGEEHEPSAVNSGVTDTGSAVYVEGNYDRDITVNIESGTFTSTNSTAVQMLKDEDTTSDTETIVISGGEFSSNVTQYVEAGKIAVKYTHNNEDTYFVGTEKQINEMVKDAVSGDEIEVIQGNINLTISAGGVKVSNSGGGTVAVNNEPVMNNIVITEEPKPTDPATPTDPNQPGSTDPTESTAAGSGATATGDNTNLTLVFAIDGSSSHGSCRDSDLWQKEEKQLRTKDCKII